MGQNDPPLESSQNPANTKKAAPTTDTAILSALIDQLPAGHQSQHLAGFLTFRHLDASLFQDLQLTPIYPFGKIGVA